MRALMIAAAVLCMAPAAQAQTQDYSGTWSFQTEPYGNEQYGVIMSGAAVFTAAASGRYDVRLIANERIIQRADGQSQVLTARQTCTGESDGAVLNIRCELAEPVEGYQPDNFVLQAGENADALIGALDSSTSAQVTFTRIR